MRTTTTKKARQTKENEFSVCIRRKGKKKGRKERQNRERGGGREKGRKERKEEGRKEEGKKVWTPFLGI